MNDTVNEINTACINDAVEIVSRLKPIYTLKHARRQQEDLFLYGRGLPVLEIHEPGSLEEYSGQFKIRMPRSLHRDLAEHSKKEGISMNQYCIYLLSKNDALLVK